MSASLVNQQREERLKIAALHRTIKLSIHFKHSKVSLIRVDCQSYSHAEEIMHTASFCSWLNESYNSPCLFSCNSDILCLLDSNHLDHLLFAWPIWSSCLLKYCWPPLTLLSPCFADYLPPLVCNSIASKKQMRHQAGNQSWEVASCSSEAFSTLSLSPLRAVRNLEAGSMWFNTGPCAV